MNKLKLEYGNLMRKHMRNEEWGLTITHEQFIKMRRAVRRKATRELADAALRAYLGVLGIPVTGALYNQPMQKLAALAISGKRIARLSTSASNRLDKIAKTTKVEKAKSKTRIVHSVKSESFIALG